MKNKKIKHIDNPIEYIFEQYQLNPKKDCIIFGDLKISYKEFLEQILEFSKKLKNIKKKEKIIISVKNPLKHIIAIYACFYRALVPVPYPADNINEVISLSKEINARLVILDNKIKFKKKIIYFKNLSTKKINFNNTNFHKFQALPESIAMIYFTSGTTSGINKGVLQTFRNLDFTKNRILKKTKITSKIRELICTPIFNAYWFGRLNSIFCVGGTIVLFEHSFNPITFFNYINKCKINAISGDTAIYLILLKYFKLNLLKISKNISWIKIASQAMPLEKKKELMKVFPKTKIIMGYGLTEAMRTTLLSFHDEKKFLASDGKPAKGITLKIVDNNNKNLKSNKIGRILIKGDHVSIGYLGKKKLWESKIFNGYYISGDLGYLNSKGYLFLKGREDDAINIGGRTVSLTESNNKLTRFIKKTNFITIGIDDPRKVADKMLVLCIEDKWNERILWSKLRLKLFEYMHKSLVPSDVFILKKFPLTQNGKIIKSKILNKIKDNKLTRLV